MRLEIFARFCTGFALALAPEQVAAQQVQRYEVHEDKLFIDMDIQYFEDDWVGDVDRQDHKIVTGLLQKYSSISKVILTGEGGDYLDSLIIAHRISSMNLSTEAHGECLSACALIFLSGKSRKLRQGAVLGFHRAAVSVEDLRQEYESDTARSRWVDEFSFAAWLHELGQMDARNFFSFALMQGVDPEAIEMMLTASKDDMWRPSKNLLELYGIVTD